jgi:hypothetical protein
MGITIDFNRRIYRFLIVMHSIKPTIWRNIELYSKADHGTYYRNGSAA